MKELPAKAPRDLSLEQAQILRLQQNQENMKEHLDHITQASERLVVQSAQQQQALSQPSRRHLDDEVESEYGIDIDVEQQWQRRQQWDPIITIR